MENENTKKISEEKLERVTAGIIIDNVDCRDLCLSKYRPRLILCPDGVDYSENLV